ncbi:hypothetical protein J4558_14730 [Leptolyngbya sp. 15MV]|nr:hypothetical protein J4558_14730 [Leptolyngbya sp. 15MV]
MPDRFPNLENLGNFRIVWKSVTRVPIPNARRGRAALQRRFILAGDVCYEAPMTAHILPWLRAMAARCEVWVADPGRAYLPKDRLEPIARYAVPTSLELEDRATRDVTIFRLLP